jgi:TATA-binding protein-associated factor
MTKSGRSLSDISLAPKLLAIKQLLSDCGIGRDDEEEGEADADGGSRHRVLIFAQMKVRVVCVSTQGELSVRVNALIACIV